MPTNARAYDKPICDVLRVVEEVTVCRLRLGSFAVCGEFNLITTYSITDTKRPIFTACQLSRGP